MNKRKIIKLAVFTLVITALTVVLATTVLAAADAKVTFNYGSSTQIKYINAGDSITLPQTDVVPEHLFYGWVDKYGTVYEAGAQVTVNSDKAFYAAFGPCVSSSDDIKSAFNDAVTYIRLENDITVDEQLVLDSGVFVIDTNGYTLNLNTDGDGILGKDTGVIITGNGSLVHNNVGANVNFVLNSLINLAPENSFNNLFAVVDKDVSVTTNMGFVGITSNIERYDGVFSATVYGELNCDRLARTNGILNGAVNIHATATLNLNCDYLFEDISTSEAERFIILTIYGGNINAKYLAGYASDYAKYKAIVLGGSFSKDVTNCFPNGNYVFEQSKSTLRYDFKKCNHSGPVISGIPNSCTAAAYLTYKCIYCDSEYMEALLNGIGHTEIVTIESNFVTTEKETRPGYYKYYCQRCGNSRYEVFFPDPSEVYVNVIIRNLKEELETIRVPSSMLYSFNGTRLMSFSTEYIQFEYNITQENILSVEIPLGTTEIYGNYQHNAAVGVFCRNPHLEEVVLPESLVNINQYAFYYMDQLKSIKGLEHVSGTISKCAFEQYHNFAVLDQMVVNAKEIGENAFKNIRMNSLTIGENVSTIRSGAFAVNGGVEVLVKEIFVVGNFIANGKNLTEVLGSYVRKSYDSSNQQFGTLPIVYLDHQCEVIVYEPTCTTSGYTHHICKNCSYERIDNELPQGSHEYEEEPIDVAPTCMEQGYSVKICIHCGEEDPSTKVPNKAKDPNNHDYTFSEAPKYINIDTLDYIPDGSVCMNYYYMVGKCQCGALDLNAPIPDGGISKPTLIHVWDKENYIDYKEPNCGEWGYAVVACTVCKTQETAPLEPTDQNHKWGSPVVIKEATCTETGIKEFKCTICDSEEGTRRVTDKIDPTNHLWDEGTVTKEPTENASGIKTFKCTRKGCGETTTQGIKRLDADHSLPPWAIVLIVIGGVLLAGGVVLTLYFTLFKKKKISEGYKYKFNTLK